MDFYLPDNDRIFRGYASDQKNKKAVYRFFEMALRDRLKSFSKDHVTYLRLGVIYREQGRFKKSVTFLKKSVRYSPPDQIVQALYELASTYKELGCFDMAISVLNGIPEQFFDRQISELIDFCREYNAGCS